MKKITFYILISIFFLTSNNKLVYGEYDFPKHMYLGSKDITSAAGLAILSVGAGLSLISYGTNIDDSVKKHYSNLSPEKAKEYESFGYLGNKILGTGIPGAALAFSQIGYGHFGKSDSDFSYGESHIEALLASFVYTSAIKIAVHRKRPVWNTNNSFPSGHTSTMFTSAANIQNTYGGIPGVIAIALASYTGFSRVSTNAHYLSDVIFGASLGYAVGYAYTLHHKDVSVKSYEISFYPYFDTRKEFGLQGYMSF